MKKIIESIIIKDKLYQQNEYTKATEKSDIFNRILFYIAKKEYHEIFTIRNNVDYIKFIINDITIIYNFTF